MVYAKTKSAFIVHIHAFYLYYFDIVDIMLTSFLINKPGAVFERLCSFFSAFLLKRHRQLSATKTNTFTVEDKHSSS